MIYSSLTFFFISKLCLLMYAEKSASCPVCRMYQKCSRYCDLHARTLRAQNKAWTSTSDNHHNPCGQPKTAVHTRLVSGARSVRQYIFSIRPFSFSIFFLATAANKQSSVSLKTVYSWTTGSASSGYRSSSVS